MELNEGTVATVPQSDDLVKLGKRKAWAKFLAYEVTCWLLCFSAAIPKAVKSAHMHILHILPLVQVTLLPARLLTCMLASRATYKLNSATVDYQQSKWSFWHCLQVLGQKQYD